MNLKHTQNDHQQINNKPGPSVPRLSYKQINKFKVLMIKRISEFAFIIIYIGDYYIVLYEKKYYK